jgi:hypothetical protein
MTRTSTVTPVIAIFVSSMIFLSLAVSHAAEKAPDDDAFLLGCIWTGDHKRTVCGEFTTRASCEREGRAAVASGELSKFECISAVTIDWGALFDGVFRSIFEEPTAAGPGGSDQPMFGRQMPVRIAAPDRAYLQRLFPNTVLMVAGPSAPDPKLWHPGQAYQGSVAPGLLPPPMLGQPNTYMLPGGSYGPMHPGGDWAKFMQNARPSANIEDYRRARGKPFIVQ